MEFDRVKFIGLRVAKKFSQGGLAKELEVGRSAVAGWEQGKATPNIQQINKAAEVLGVEPEELVIKGVKA